MEKPPESTGSGGGRIREMATWEVNLPERASAFAAEAKGDGVGERWELRS